MEFRHPLAERSCCSKMCGPTRTSSGAAFTIGLSDLMEYVFFFHSFSYLSQDVGVTLQRA